MSEMQDMFKNMAKKTNKQLKEKAENKGTFTSFDPIEWTGYEDKGTSKAIRMVSPMIVTNSEDLSIRDNKGTIINDKYSARIVKHCEIIGDDLKKFHAYVPSKEEEPQHFYWRLMDTVLKRTWVDKPNSDKKEAVYVHQKSHPELVDRFLTNGYNFNKSSYQFDKGWKSTDKLFMNVIDRARVDEHKENKKYFLLSERANVVEDKVYFDRGIKSYTTYPDFLKLQSTYGAFNTFDMLITRIGTKDKAYEIYNASRLKEGGLLENIPEDLVDFISNDIELTEEEKSWEAYDLESITRPTSALKWFNRIKVLVKEVDGALHTHFYEELEKRAEEEKIVFEALRKEKEESEPSTSSSETTTTPTSEPSTRRGSAVESTSELTWDMLEAQGFKGKEFFTPEVKGMIKDTLDDKGNVIWNIDSSISNPLCTNTDCSQNSPEMSEVQGCIKCGTKF